MPEPSTSGDRSRVVNAEPLSHQSLPIFRTVGEPAKSGLERALSLFADVRAGEGLSALLLSLNVFLLLAAYYLLRPARQALILTEGGAVAASYSSAAQALLLVAVVPFYGWLASRVPRMRLITITAVFFAMNLVVFYLLGTAGVREGIAFYVWLGIFNVFVISQFWAFANDIYTEAQGQRLFPLIGVGASLGAWVGAATVVPLVQRLRFTPYTLMFCAAAVLLAALVVTVMVNRRETARSSPEAAQVEQAPLGRQGGFELIFADRYLTWIAVLTILLNIVNTTGEFLLNRMVETQALARFGTDPSLLAESQRFVGAFFGSFNANVSLLGFLLQLLVTSRVMRYMGVRGALFILPIIALVNYSVIAVVPLLAIVRVGKILENSTDYSIQNTIRQALYLPLSREAKYKAKAAIDTFFTRSGDVVSAGFVAAGTAVGVGAGGFAWLNVALTVAWLGVAGKIARAHRQKAA
ncbi:MAG: Npt1/Npt2 family nucleotide transporter [Acidobacteriota bacterium]